MKLGTLPQQLCIDTFKYHVSVFLQYFLLPSVKLPSNNLQSKKLQVLKSDMLFST